MVATTGIAIELQDRTKQGARAITRSLDDIKKSARETATSVDKLDDNFDRLKDELKETGRSADKAGREFDALAGKAKKASDATGGMGRNFTALKGAFAAVGTSIVVKQFFDLLDVSTQINNRLKLVTDSTYALGLAQQQLFEVSQKSRVGFDQTVDLYSRLARSSEELGLTQSELVDITETISQAITISGASAQAADAALMQLGQGIASGTLRGEELNSVLEQTPRLAQAIADGIGVSIGQLRALGAEGALTSETVVKAIQSQQGGVRTEFGKTSATVSQSMTVITNSLTKLVSKIDESAGVSNTFANALLGIADAIDELSKAEQRQGSVRANVRRRELADGSAERVGLFPEGQTFGFEPGGRGRARREQAQQAVAGQAQAQRDEALNELLFTVSEGFKDIATDVKAETELVKEAFIEGLKTRPATTGPRPIRPTATGPSLVGPASFAVDERVFSFEQNLKNVSTFREIEAAAIDATIDAIRRFNPELAEFADAGQDIYDAFTSGNVAAQITSVANGLFLLLDTFFGISDSGEKARRALEDLNRALEQADRSAQSVIESLFFEDIAQGQQRIFTVFEDFFALLNQGAIDIGNVTGAVNDLPETQADAVRRIFDILAEFDVLGVGGTLEDFADSVAYSEQRFVAAVEASFGSFDEFEKIFLQTFGDTGSFAEVATQFFDTSEAFDHLRDSAEDATTAVDRLSAAEQAATRLRINAQEIALRTQLSQEFRRAGSDVFEQRAAYNRFQQAVRQLQYMGRAGAALTGGGSGAGASTTAATTTATGGTTATTTGTTTAGVSPINATVAINAAMVTPNQLVQLPSEQDMESYYSAELLPVLSDPVAPILSQFSDNIRANKVRIYPWSLFDVPSTSVWSSYWSRFLLARADTEQTGPDSVAAQILDNVRANKKRINPEDMFIVPTSSIWSTYWSVFLLGRADTPEVGPDNVSAQVLDNARANKKRINPDDMFIVPTSSIWSTYWSVFLLGRADTGEHGPDNVAAQVLDNAIANKKRINPTDLFSIASGDDFRSFWQQGLNSVVVTDEYGPGAAIAYTKEYTANRKLDIKPTDLFSTPSVLDFFFLFADMVPNITTGLNAVLNNLPIVPVDVANLIDFDASGLSEAINNAVKEAVSDRSYDEPQRLGFTSGRA